MNLLDLFKGKKVKVDIGYGVFIEMEIKDVKENKHSERYEIEEATPANDWWPQESTRTWLTYTVFFTNGYQKDFKSFEEIKIEE